MKKWLSLILTVILVLSVCSFAGAADKVEISLYRDTFELESGPDPAQVKKVEDAINAYIDGKINVKITLTDVANSQFPEIARLALDNKGVNLLWTAAWMGTVGCNDLVPKNAVYDITELLPGTTLYQSMDEAQWESTKYNGRNYFIPIYKDNVEGYDFMIRKELVDKYGWDLASIKSLKDLEPILKDAAEEEELDYPFLLQGTAMFYRFMLDRFDFFTGDAESNFVAVDRETNAVVNTVQSEDYLEYCKLMGKWADNDYLSVEESLHIPSNQTPQGTDWAVSWWTDTPVATEASGRYNQEIVLAPATKRYSHSTSALGSCFCISADSTEEQAKACIEFLGLLYTDQTLADIYTFGIEGEDFEYVKAEGETVNHVKQHSDKYKHLMWESASATIVSPMEGEPDNKAELYREFNGGAETSVAAGFRFDRTPVQDAYDKCKEVARDQGYLLETGAYGEDGVEDAIKEYQEALDKAGYQKVLKEFQKQYAEWLAAK
ncbi:MAG: DUF3502 domain-containing protein [Clostridia bacterium]|nr:DUF3502 domain-containing protein [Clostridia bacterium]